DLYNALSKRCQMVTSASPGTLRLRIALTDATTPNATVNTVATYTPYVSTAYSLASLGFNNGVGYFAGRRGRRLCHGCNERDPAVGSRRQARRHHCCGGEYAQYLARCRPCFRGLVGTAGHEIAGAWRMPGLATSD